MRHFLSACGIFALLTCSAPSPVVEEQEIRYHDPISVQVLSSQTDKLLPGESLSDVLARNGFLRREIHEISEALSDYMNVRRIKANQEVHIYRDSDDDSIYSIEIPVSDFKKITLHPTSPQWRVEEVTVDPVLERNTIKGTVSNSLYQSLRNIGEGGNLAFHMAQVLSYDIDFHRDTRNGDGYSVVVDKLYNSARVWKGYGDIHAVQYVNRGREIVAFRFELPGGKSGYYDFNGMSLQRAFLASPLTYTRISSGFTSRRLHPIYRVYRPHYGVDYAAPTGTPVMATARGKVIQAGRRGANGNMVTLRHDGGYETKYLHLSRIPQHSETRTGSEPE